MNACPACLAQRAALAKAERLAAKREAHEAEVAARAAERAKTAKTITGTCPVCTTPFTYTLLAGDTPKKHCSRRCMMKHKRVIYRGVRRAKELGCQTIDKHADPFHVMRRDNWTCRECGAVCDPQHYGRTAKDAPCCDHVVAIVNGGSHTETNLQTLCWYCNSKKAVREFRPEVITSAIASK